MDSSLEFSFDNGGSRLLSESPVLPSASSSEADLSISELSLSDKPSSSKPFSLLAQPPSPSTPIQTRRYVSDDDRAEKDEDLGDDDDDNYEGEEEEEEEGDVTQKQTDQDTDEQREQNKRVKAKLREDKLHNDLSILRKLNTVFSSFNEALEDVGSANERISQQLVQTEGLLNKYMSILAKSEEVSQLIFDEEWGGADQDDEIIQGENEERVERARKEMEERALAEQRERERLENEAKERREREERERGEREKKEVVVRGGRGGSSSGVRGVRATRASIIATRRAQFARAVNSTRGSPRGVSGTASRGSGTTRSRGSGIARGTVPRGGP
ncbi:hypothetical protein BDP27DRAFT_500222 [Rhodocollybia butyracea]|uniref:DASH complex subunit DUO1 n=1 Tax=Rhodocollybia butyracea TaxID=206335 RepID=A0A9P5Q0M5_9AGAR|nr:hypothetical protein BDP27DRAFT_500222 [Rhodocollybia butyracea]